MAYFLILFHSNGTWYKYIRTQKLRTSIIATMESQKSARNLKKQQRIRIYKRKLHSIGQYTQRVGRVNRLKQIAFKRQERLVNLSSQMTALQKTMNKNIDHNKLLQRYVMCSWLGSV